MREANIQKSRECQICKRKIFATAKEIKEHASVCERLNKLGLERG